MSRRVPDPGIGRVAGFRPGPPGHVVDAAHRKGNTMELSLLDELESQHRMVEDLLEQLSEAEEAEQQRPLVEQLQQALARHMEIEEGQVYPELAKLEGEMAEEAEIEHDLARKGLAQLTQMIGKPGFGAAVAMVEAGIAHHVEEEEDEAFPKLREAMGGERGRSGGSRQRRGTKGSRGSARPGGRSSGGDATKAELYEQAQRAGIEGRSQMTKDELASALRSR